MFIIEKPYASEFLVDTIIQNDLSVLDNKAVRESDIEEGAFRLWSSDKAKKYYSTQEFPLIYSNSESAIDWVLNKLPLSNTSSYIKLFKDKVAFREFLKELYPNFYFRAVDYKQLKEIKAKDVLFPIVLKPAVGFLSLGVHTVYNAQDWNDVISKLDKEMKYAESLYPKEVLNSSKFIIEELIEGEEFAIDVYYDRNGEAVILNIFQHPFLDKNDVRDRIYIMSSEIMVKYLSKFSEFLQKIGSSKNIRNFPAHVEVRVTSDGRVIPIEVNPMRFAGWCTTDVAKYAWGINVYEYFQKQHRPNWNEILEKAGSKIFYFSMAEVSSDIPKQNIKEFDYNGFLSNYSNVLELRRINFKTNPLYAIIFGSTKDKNEITKILQLNTSDYVRM